MPKKIKRIKVEPFLRWAGGKRWLLKHIQQIGSIEYNDYHEIFLGGAAVFFSLEKYNKAFLSDLNSELIETYVCVKEDLNNVLDVLKSFRNTETQYYKIRKAVYEKDYERAAKFIYLNQTSFNGIYRVNRDGVFNVPYGFRPSTYDFINEENLISVSKKLQNVHLAVRDFKAIVNKAKPGDLVFLDPPYTVAHENNGFIAYNQKIFSLADQISLASIVEKLSEKGVYYILTNAKHGAIKKIYNKIAPPVSLTRSSRVGGTGARREDFGEYLFTNCPNLL